MVYLLPDYIDVRGELDKVITAISNIGEVLITVKDSIDIQSILTSKFDLAIKLAITTAKRINALVAWSLVNVPMDPGPGWYQLGQLGPVKRNPFHHYFSQQEAEELQTMVMGLKQASYVVERFGLEMDELEMNQLLHVLTLKLESDPDKAGVLTYLHPMKPRKGL